VRTRSYLPPKFHAFSTFSKSVTVEPVDATLCGIGTPYQIFERRHDLLQRLELNRYLTLFFVRDDAYRFEILLKNAPEPGIIGERFAILWTVINDTMGFDYGVYNHATRRWVILQTASELHHNIWRRSPSSARYLTFSLVATASLIAGGVVWFIAPTALSAGAGIAVLLTAAFGFAVERVSVIRLWRFLREALAAIEIS
jgi:hypothetical protein